MEPRDPRGAEQEGRAVHRAVLSAHQPGGEVWRNVSYESEGVDRPRQSPPGPLGKAVGEGGQKPEKTLEGPLAFVVALEENIPDPSITGAGNPGSPKRRRQPAGPGVPSKGRSASQALVRWEVALGRQWGVANGTGFKCSPSWMDA